jgi:hypothetical protein
VNSRSENRCVDRAVRGSKRIRSLTVAALSNCLLMRHGRVNNCSENSRQQLSLLIADSDPNSNFQHDSIAASFRKRYGKYFVEHIGAEQG